MPTKVPRITFTPTAAVDDVLRRIAAAANKSPARFLREFLTQLTPALMQVAEVLQVSKENEDKAIRMLRGMAQGAVDEVNQLGLDLEDRRVRIRQTKPARVRGAQVAPQGTPAHPARNRAAMPKGRGKPQGKPKGRRSG